jgi:single-strand DNA-binding protein
MVRFSIATTESYVNKTGEKVNDTHWHNIVAWNKTADIIEKFVTKGNKVGIEGKLTSRSWDDKDGTKRYITEVLCNEVLLLSPKES